MTLEVSPAQRTDCSTLFLQIPSGQWGPCHLGQQGASSTGAGLHLSTQTGWSSKLMRVTAQAMVPQHPRYQGLLFFIS